MPLFVPHPSALLGLLGLLASACATPSPIHPHFGKPCSALSDTERRVPVQRVNPFYPNDLERARIEGYTDIRFRLSSGGRPIDLEVFGSEPPGGFDHVALRALRQWRYCPPTDSAQPHNVLTVRLSFTLHR